MKPIIVVIVYRRYLELVENLQRIRGLASRELKNAPIVILWTDPDSGHQWILNSLKPDLTIQRINESDETSKSISYHCSRDIRTSLQFVKQHFGPKYYTIVHCCDVCPKDGVYHSIQEAFTNGKEAFLVLLPNSVVNRNIWHTNFFAVSCNENYWPPLIEDGDADILEHKWGKQIRNRGLTNFEYAGNINFKTFDHYHKVDDYNLYRKADQCPK